MTVKYSAPLGPVGSGARASLIVRSPKVAPPHCVVGSVVEVAPASPVEAEPPSGFDPVTGLIAARRGMSSEYWLVRVPNGYTV